MAITNSFREAVSNGNVKGIRIMMTDSLLVDPSFEEFNEMSRFASAVGDLYDVHDGRELIGDKSAWDDNYMDKLMVQVVNNFSRQRIDHLKKVIRQLRPVAARRQSQISTSHSNESQRQQQSQPPQSSYQEKKRQDQHSGSYRGTKIAGGAIVGAVVGGTVAAVANVTVIGGAVIGAVAGGAIVAVVTNGEQ
ncbi:MAG: DUF3482 domain-containing protein [Clostridiales Family XIII bacterium]|jgi:hypothetical protein|nr:DUF3482 domain-containing protein [Clostridiales Family XIII bacterium]